MAVVHGNVGINFGIGTAVGTLSGLFQTREHHYLCESKDIKDGGETTVGKGYWNFSEEATFTFVSNTYLGVIYSNNIPAIGYYITVYDAINYPAIEGTTWKVEDIITNSSNTTSTRITLKLTRHRYITQ